MLFPMINPETNQEILYKFDWNTIDENVFRGDDNTFPCAATLVVVPEYTIPVISAVNNFPEYLLVPREDINIKMLDECERGIEEDEENLFRTLQGDQLGLELFYYNAPSKQFVFTLFVGLRRTDIQ